MTAIFVLPATWIVHLGIKNAPAILWWVVAICATAAVAAIVHSRVTNDWRARYGMNLETFERRHAVARNIRIDRR